MKWLALPCCLIFAQILWAEEPTLVRVGGAWRYFKGFNEPSVPITAWQTNDFDDSNWPLGPSGFGFGGIDDATYLYDMPWNYQSVYIRNQFLVDDPASIRWLVLRVDYQDGFVAYLNGQEIARNSLLDDTNTPAPFDFQALPHAAGTAEEIDVSAWIPLLKSGTNLLAIHGQLANLHSSLYILTPELLANFTRGPVVQNVSTNQVQIVWKTPIASDSVVEFNVSTNLGLVCADTNLVLTHVITLTNLAPNTIYYYRVSSSANERTAAGPLYHCRTLRMSGGPVSFVVVGDTGSGSVAQYNIAQVMGAANPDLVMHVGDVVYPSLTAGRMDLKCFSVYQPQMRSVPFFFAAGNHDYYANFVDFKDAFYLPTNNVTGTEDFFAFDHGEVHFVVLDTAVGAGASYGPGTAQYQWLETDLATSTKPWKFLFFHNTIRDSGPHRYDDYNFNGIPDRIELQQSVGVLAGRYNVQVIFTGHNHAYERCAPFNGTHTIISGGGGASLYYFAGEWDETSSFFWARYNCVKVTVDSDTLELAALGLNGEVFDRTSIQRTVPSRRLYESSWHAPTVESAPANDEQGNIVGQTFSFIGNPIRAFAGQFSNLGSLKVNNDDQALYFGLEGVMITGSQNVFLFVESSRQPGVTNLVGLGNGLVDSEGQGVDGLDILGNLSFTNFTPSIGCILGDQFADGQYRSFARSNLTFNIGQGAFHLTPGFPDVAGVRLQQFNVSPQIFSLPGEQNANFIELAIPFSEIGGLAAGDRIKIGAVVAGGAVQTNSDQRRRWLDTGFIGYNLQGSGTGPVVLEGIEIALAAPPFPANQDSDGDGLYDNWEVAHGLDPHSGLGSNGADADPDRDGVANWQEQIAGTDPHDASSVFRVRSHWTGDHRLQIDWPAVVGKSYQLEYADGVDAQFKAVPDPIFPRQATNVWEHYVVDPSQLGSNVSARFYRLRLVP